MITDRIRHKREDLGYSQEYMAERLQISPSTYGSIERGETKLDVDRLKAIAAILATDPLYLLGGESLVVNNHDQRGGTCGCYHVVNQHGTSDDVLKTISDRHEAHVKEIRLMNDRLLSVQERLLEVVERLTGK